MKPTDDDSDTPDVMQDEMVAQIVPLRRRQDGTARDEQPHNKSRAAAEDTDDWSVFDPPEDLKLAERPEPDQHNQTDFDHDFSGEALAHHWTSMPRIRSRLAVFTGMVVTMFAIAALIALTLKGHAGASPHRPAMSTPNTSLTSAGRALARPQGGTSSPRHDRAATWSSNHKLTKRRSSLRGLPHIATAGTSTEEEGLASRRTVEPAPTPAQSGPSSSTGTSTTQDSGGEFGFEQ